MERNMPKSWRCLPTIFLTLITGIFVPAETPAQEAPRLKKVVVDLKQAIRMAVAVNPEIKQFQARVSAALARKAQADAGRYPQFDLKSVLGPSQRARIVRDRDGIPTTDIHTVETRDSSTNPTIDGIFGRADFTLAQPLYTFGKISSLREAAAHGISAEQGRVDEKTSEVVLKVKEVYYGLLLTMELKNLTVDIKEELDKALEKVEKQLEVGAPGADEVDRFKLLTFRGELEKGINEVEKGIDIAKDALRTLLGLERDQELELATTTLEPEARPVEEVERYVAQARERRPEFAQIKAGLLAKGALVQAARSDLYPQFFVAIDGSYARATNRTLLRNPFIVDPINGGGAAPVIGFKWHFDFGIMTGKVAEARAELLEVQYAKELAEGGIPLQVRKAYRELEEAKQNITATDEAYRNARKWLIASVANFDLGVGEAKDVADAILAFARMRAENFRAIFNYNMSLANLDHVTGMDVGEGK